jgi:CheY-like chemotaxis protein
LEPANGSVRPPAAAGQATILVVDDFAEVQELFAHLLQQAGHRVLVANDAQQALELAGNHETIDLLVTDLNMPGMNGLDLARWCHSRFPLSKALLVSGSVLENEADPETTPWLPFLDKSEAFTRLVPMVEKLLAQEPLRSEGFGPGEIAQRASAETKVLREIREKGNHSGSWLQVVNE